MTRPLLLLVLVGVGANGALAARTARASSELSADVQTLSTVRAAYGRVVHLKPRFLERGERLPLALPVELLDPKEPSCTTVSLLGVTGAHFVVRFSEFDPGAPSSAFPESSAAGAFEVVRCGAAKPYLGQISVELRSPRGLLETLVSNAPAGVPPLLDVLADRNPGAELELGDPGPRPAPAPVAVRLAHLEARAHREAALSFERDEWRAREDGSGSALLALGVGCHELTLLETSPPVAGAPPVDLDLELVDEDGSAPLAVDRAEDVDASGLVCLGAPSNVELRFIGGSPEAHLLLTHARWDLPAGLPMSFGPEARARLARVARASHFAANSPPIYESLGVQGTTELPFQVEPSGCYTVLLAPLRGAVQSLSLSALAHAPGQAARGAGDALGSTVSFCARGATVATLEVDGRDNNLAWILAAWETGRLAPGLEAL